ncbi:hypothetical protein D3C71_1493310 [compost metagenome]
MQCGNEIIVAVLALVVNRGAALHDARQPLGIEGLILARRTPDLFGKRQHGAAIAVGHADEACARLLGERQGLTLRLLGAF